MQHVDLSIVVPVYNSEATLRELVERLKLALAGVAGGFQIVMVDDGSRDGSWHEIEQLRQENPDTVIGVQLMRNFGQHNATMCGFRHARGNLIVTMDDDLQHPPEEVPKLVKAMQDPRVDVAYGVYHQAKKHKPWRNVGSRLMHSSYRRVFQSDVHPTSFRIIRRTLLESIFFYSLNYTVIDGLLAWNSQRMIEVDVEHRPQARGRSRYSLRRLISTAITMISNFSLWPLRVVSMCGMLASLAGMVLGAYYLVMQLTDSIKVPGYASIIVAIFVLGGLQLLALGVIGEYLGRVHMNINRKPQYTERAVLEGSTPDESKPEPDTEATDPSGNTGVTA